MNLQIMLSRWYSTALSFIHYNIGLTYRYWANAHGLHSEYEKAIAHFTRALAYKPDNARIYLDRGILYWREINHPRRAILDLSEALNLDADISEAYFNRGIAHQQLREYNEAITDYKVYLEKGNNPYWREYAESMIRELGEWTSEDMAGAHSTVSFSH